MRIRKNQETIAGKPVKEGVALYFVAMVGEDIWTVEISRQEAAAAIITAFSDDAHNEQD